MRKDWNREWKIFLATTDESKHAAMQFWAWGVSLWSHEKTHIHISVAIVKIDKTFWDCGAKKLKARLKACAIWKANQKTSKTLSIKYTLQYLLPNFIARGCINTHWRHFQHSLWGPRKIYQGVGSLQLSQRLRSVY